MWVCVWLFVGLLSVVKNYVVEWYRRVGGLECGLYKPRTDAWAVWAKKKVRRNSIEILAHHVDIGATDIKPYDSASSKHYGVSYKNDCSII